MLKIVVFILFITINISYEETTNPKKTLHYSRVFGGNGGEPFTTGASSNPNHHVRIVRIRSGGNIDSIQFYVGSNNNDGYYTGKFGGNF